MTERYIERAKLGDRDGESELWKDWESFNDLETDGLCLVCAGRETVELVLNLETR